MKKESRLRKGCCFPCYYYDVGDDDEKDNTSNKSWNSFVEFLQMRLRRRIHPQRGDTRDNEFLHYCLVRVMEVANELHR